MTNLKKSKAGINAGIDVGKQPLDVCIHEKQLYWQEDNNDQDIKRMLKRLAHYRKACSGYWEKVTRDQRLIGSSPAANDHAHQGDKSQTDYGTYLGKLYQAPYPCFWSGD